jgi:hypothetical protein
MSKTGSDTDTVGQGGPELPFKALADFHRDPRSRRRLASRRHDLGAARRRPSASEVHGLIMRTRDLSKKGSEKRQREYAGRTAGKAVRQAE